MSMFNGRIEEMSPAIEKILNERVIWSNGEQYMAGNGRFSVQDRDGNWTDLGVVKNITVQQNGPPPITVNAIGDRPYIVNRGQEREDVMVVTNGQSNAFGQDFTVMGRIGQRNNVEWNGLSIVDTPYINDNRILMTNGTYEEVTFSPTKDTVYNDKVVFHGDVVFNGDVEFNGLVTITGRIVHVNEHIKDLAELNLEDLLELEEDNKDLEAENVRLRKLLEENGITYYE